MEASKSQPSHRQARAHIKWIVFLLLIPGSYLACQVASRYIATYAQDSWLMTIAIILYPLRVVLPVVALIFFIKSFSQVFRSWRNSNGHFSVAEQQAIENQRHADLVAEAPALAAEQRRSLLRGDEQPTLIRYDLATYPEERFLFSGTAQYARFYGTEANYWGSSTFAVGHPVFVAAAFVTSAIADNRARNRALLEAQAQWRETQALEVIVSDQRILCNTFERGWLSFHFGGMTAVYPDLTSQSIVCQFHDAEPLQLQGPAALPISNLVVYHVLGHEALAGHPVLRQLDSV